MPCWIIQTSREIYVGFKIISVSTGLRIIVLFEVGGSNSILYLGHLDHSELFCSYH